MIITNIKNSIIKTIKISYPTYEVYDEIVKQGLVEPCFFVRVIEQNTKKQISNHYKFNIMLDIHYFLDINTGNLNEQYHEMAETLYEKLELFTDLSGGYLRGLNKRHDIQDSVLHFFVDISVSAKIPINEVVIGTVEANYSVKDV